MLIALHYCQPRSHRHMLCYVTKGNIPLVTKGNTYTKGGELSTGCSWFPFGTVVGSPLEPTVIHRILTGYQQATRGVGSPLVLYGSPLERGHMWPMGANRNQRGMQGNKTLDNHREV